MAKQRKAEWVGTEPEKGCPMCHGLCKQREPDQGQRYMLEAVTRDGERRKIGYTDFDPWSLASSVLMHPNHVSVVITDREKVKEGR